MKRKIDKLPEKEFRIMIVKMIKTLESKHLYKLTFLCLCRYYGLSVWLPDVIKHLQSNVLKNVGTKSEIFRCNYQLYNGKSDYYRNGMWQWQVQKLLNHLILPHLKNVFLICLHNTKICVCTIFFQFVHVVIFRLNSNASKCPLKKRYTYISEFT